MVILDTSLLIDALSGGRRSMPALQRSIRNGEQLALVSLVVYEWRRGPRTADELATQEALLPTSGVLEFGAADASAAADIYRAVTAPRDREIDLAIAACAIRRSAQLWTLNVKDVRDVPGLSLYQP